MSQPPTLLKVRRWAGGVLLVLSVLFFGRYAIVHFDEVPRLAWNGAQWGVFFASVVLYTLSIGVVGFIWQLLLRDHALKPHWWQLQIIFSMAQFAKYLPGNVAQHVGRIYMAREAGIPVTVTIHTMIAEALFGVAVGAILALLSLWFVIDQSELSEPLAVQPYMLGLLMLAAMLLPWVAVRSLNIFFPRLASKISGGGPIVEPRFYTALAVAGLFLVCFLISGLVLKLHAVWLFNADDASVLEFTALFAVAWVAGYLVPGAPAGLGIREALMVLLFSTILDPAIAVGLSITLRVTTTFGDGSAFMMGMALRRWAMYVK